MSINIENNIIPAGVLRTIDKIQTNPWFKTRLGKFLTFSPLKQKVVVAAASLASLILVV